MKKTAAVLAVLALALSLAFAAPPDGKGKYKIVASNTTPAAGQTFLISGQNFRAEKDIPLVTVAFGVGHGTFWFTIAPERGRWEIAATLPQFDPATGRDLSLGALGTVYERVQGDDGSYRDVERGSVLVFVGQ